MTDQRRNLIQQLLLSESGAVDVSCCRSPLSAASECWRASRWTLRSMPPGLLSSLSTCHASATAVRPASALLRRPRAWPIAPGVACTVCHVYACMTPWSPLSDSAISACSGHAYPTAEQVARGRPQRFRVCSPFLLALPPRRRGLCMTSSIVDPRTAPRLV